MQKNENISLVINCHKENITDIDIQKFKDKYKQIYFNIDDDINKILNIIETEYYSIWDYNKEYKNINNLKEISINNDNIISSNLQLKINNTICIVINISNDDLTVEQIQSLKNIITTYNNDYIICLIPESNKFINKEFLKLLSNNITFIRITTSINEINIYDLYSYLYSKGFNWVLQINELSYVSSYNLLSSFIECNYDIYIPPYEIIYNKTWNSEIKDISYYMINLNTLLTNNITNFTTINSLFNIINENYNKFEIAPLELQWAFCGKDYLEDYYQLFKFNTNTICTNKIYKSEYYDDIDPFFNKSNYTKQLKKNFKLYQHELNIISKEQINKLKYRNTLNDFYKFIYDVTFPNWETIFNELELANKENRIPKIIHFCFLDYKHIPNKIKICINTWREKLHDYIFINWTPYILNISNNDFLMKCIKFNQFAFFADFIRCYALYYFGGIYLDSDIYVHKNFNDLLNNDYVFDKEICEDMPARLECGCLLTKKHNKLIQYLLEFYINDIKFPDDLNWWDNNYLVNSYIMPDVVKYILKKYDIKFIDNITNLSEYIYLQKNNYFQDKIFYLLNSSYLSCPMMQQVGPIFEYYHAYASHCFTNSYTNKLQ